MNYFFGRDLELIEALVYQPELKPSYDVMRDALVWRDEWTNDLSSEGFEKVCKLWTARSFIHRGIPFSSYKLNPDLLERVWFEAKTQGFKWTGFNRLELRQQDREYYEEQRRLAREEF